MGKPKKPLYYCDPEKNVECSKSNCKLSDGSKFQDCELTSHPEYAKTDADGNPIEYVYQHEAEE